MKIECNYIAKKIFKKLTLTMWILEYSIWSIFFLIWSMKTATQMAAKAKTQMLRYKGNVHIAQKPKN